MKIGLIGSGFVGSSIKNAYDLVGINVAVVDPLYSTNTINDIALACDAIFVAVPSPQSPNGECDTSILQEVLKEIAATGYVKPIISKVTAPPRVYRELQKTYPNLVHAPEFLVAATAKEDYLNGKFAIIGGLPPYVGMAESIIKLGQTKIEQTFFCSIEEASVVKYTINTFLATKVAFMNQLYDFCKDQAISFDNVSRILPVEPRLGNSHFSVPGPDGRRGFGGACFPKDTAALSFESKGIMSVLDAAISYNKVIRPE
jgi:UDPglucose 6-dehydrogenase